MHRRKSHLNILVVCTFIGFLATLPLDCFAEDCCCGQESRLTVEQVITLAKAKTADKAIINQIKETGSVFQLQVEDILKLDKAGVNIEVIKAMVATGGIGAAKAENNPESEGVPSGSRDLLLIIDSSGSMAGRTSDGATKIVQAKSTLNRLVDRLPGDLNVGLLAYGHRYAASHRLTCQDIELVAPVVQVNKNVLKSKVSLMQPRGRTPIAKSLERAAEILEGLGTDREKALVLVTDGLETCGGDPLAAAARLRQLGIKIDFYVIGFDLTPNQAKAIRAIAQAGQGKFIDARDGNALDAAFETIHQEVIIRAEPVKNKTIVSNAGPGFLTSVGQGKGNAFFTLFPFQRRDSIIELPASLAKGDIETAEFWGLGVKIVNVKEKSAAEKAGLKVGDVITQVDGQLVTLSKQLTTLLAVDPAKTAEADSRQVRVARYVKIGEGRDYLPSYTASDRTIEVPPGAYTLMAINGTPSSAPIAFGKTGSYLTGTYYTIPLQPGMRVDPQKTYEIPMNVGFKFQPTDPDRAITDVIRILDAETGTEWIRVSAYKITSGGGYPLTVPAPPGRYTLEWAHRRSEKWYTIVKDFEYDAKTLVNVKF